MMKFQIRLNFLEKDVVCQYRGVHCRFLDPNLYIRPSMQVNAMIKKTLITAMALASTIACSLPADSRGIVSGNVAKDNIQKVNNNVHWYTSLGQAEEAARQQDKMVLWIHMIGQMEGAT